MWATKAPRPHRVWWTPVSPSAPSVSWRLNNTGRKKETLTDLFQRCPHPFKPSTRVLPSRVASTASRMDVITPHRSMPGEARPFRAPARPRLFDYINTLMCAFYVPWPWSECRQVFCLSSFICRLCDGSCQCRAVQSVPLFNGAMKIPNFGCVCWGGALKIQRLLQ